MLDKMSDRFDDFCEKINKLSLSAYLRVFITVAGLAMVVGLLAVSIGMGGPSNWEIFVAVVISLTALILTAMISITPYLVAALIQLKQRLMHAARTRRRQKAEQALAEASRARPSGGQRNQDTAA